MPLLNSESRVARAPVSRTCSSRLDGSIIGINFINASDPPRRLSRAASINSSAGSIDHTPSCRERKREVNAIRNLFRKICSLKETSAYTIYALNGRTHFRVAVVNFPINPSEFPLLTLFSLYFIRYFVNPINFIFPRMYIIGTTCPLEQQEDAVCAENNF